MNIVVYSVLDAKLFDKEDEYYRAGFMFEEAGCVFLLVIAMFGEVQEKLIIIDTECL